MGGVDYILVYEVMERARSVHGGAVVDEIVELATRKLRDRRGGSLS